MSRDCMRDHLKGCISKVLLTIGWHTTMTAPLEILTDVLSNYIERLTRSTKDYANNFGMNHANLDHVALTFRDFHISVADLEEYIRNVDGGDAMAAVPLFPVPKENHLNFLKPGSKEVLTRPVHIHEHLPPMHPLLEAKEEEEVATDGVKIEPEEQLEEQTAPFKRPGDISSPELPRRARLLMEEESRPIREISSVMMTTSGFLSPAREGKLPESRTPFVANEPQLPMTIPNTQPEPIKKSPKPVKKIEKRKEKSVRDTFKPIQMEVRKTSAMKEIMKSRIKANLEIPETLAAPAAAAAAAPPPVPSTNILEDIKPPLPVSITKVPPIPKPFKFNKALEAARLKTEKLNTTITPIPPKLAATVTAPPEHVDKLIAEPDKKKVNIFKKISNVKNDKPDTRILKIKEEIKQESRESSPDLIIDEAPSDITHKVRHLSSDITIELINTPPTPSISSTTERERPMFEDYSPPHTPSTPKTPDMISHSPPLVKEKRKRKDKSRVKKKQLSPMVDQDMLDMSLERPKTPEALGFKQEKADSMTPPIPFPFTFHGFAGGPGLIPQPLVNPLFPHLPMPPLLPSFGQPPYIPPLHPGLSIPFRPPKNEEPAFKSMAASSSFYDDKSSPIVSSTTLDIPQMTPDDYPNKSEKRKEHKKEKKDKAKKKSKKDKVKDKAEKRKLKEERREKLKLKREKKEKRKEKEKERAAEIGIPKLTLKLGASSPTSHVSDTRKLNIKPIVKKDEDDFEEEEEEQREDEDKSRREMSPELAKISALVTGQPKPKSSSSAVSSTSVSSTKKDDLLREEVPRISVLTPRVGPGPGRPRIHPIKPKPTQSKRSKQQLPVEDSEGNQVWICPACGRQDDGTPMIGCDDCDAWYHWVCVGIQIPPEDSEDWYCKQCITKKQEHLHQTDKKKKRKKRERKEH